MKTSNQGRKTLAETVSADGTRIGYFTSGAGPPLLLVHGGIGDHTRWDVLRPYLEPHFTVHAMDRRGRGASGDHPDYSIEREYEDVAAVVDAINEASGARVDVYCSSFGGQCAFGAPALTSNIGRLVLYEAWPPVANNEAWTGPPDVQKRMEALLAQGEREAVVEMTYTELLGLSEDELNTVRAQSSWPARVAAAHTVLREIRVAAAAAFDAKQAASITVPTLLLVGAATSQDNLASLAPDTVAAALPNASIVYLEGQEHLADLLAPELVAEHLLAFLREDR